MKKIDISRMTSVAHQTSESYKALRTNVEFCGQDVKVIAITSCIPNEGKSNVAINLAASFAVAGKKVILIDADLRKSVYAGRLFLSEKMNGLTNILAGQCSLTESMCGTEYDNLHIILAGAIAPNPSELLGSKAFSSMVDALRKYYDYIIIDTPPLGSVIDSLVVAKKCDGVALVVAADRISYRVAQRVKKQLESSGCRILGGILNMVDMKKGSYGKYYGKYYGSYYGEY